MSQLQYLQIPTYVTKSGKTTKIELSYQVFGKTLYSAPIVLVNHALTGNSEVTGENGWWNDLIGDHKCIDTNEIEALRNWNPNGIIAEVYNIY